jgi:acyl-CoA thioesterase-2
MRTLQEVMDLIAPKQVGDFWFIGYSPLPQRRIFGGQVVAQCLMAAQSTVDDALTAHSMHAYFLRAGNPELPIEFEVDPIRDGRSFCTRRVVARQGREAIFNTSVSFQIEESGYTHNIEMPPAAAPDMSNDVGQRNLSFTTKPGQPTLMELYGIERIRLTPMLTEKQVAESLTWMRALGGLSSNPRLHQAALAMMSDYALLGAALMPHEIEEPEKNIIAASLDHSIWFHHPPSVDDFVLYDCDSPWTGGARGFSRGRFWSQSGILLASTSQECLIRPNRRD